MKCYENIVVTFYIIISITPNFSDGNRNLNDLRRAFKAALRGEDANSCHSFFKQLDERQSENIENHEFPNDFLIGCASSAFQNEGAWNEDGKAENEWDHYTHTNPNIITDRSNADVACDSYHKYKEDVQLIKNVGFDVFRFSISWARVLPTGDEHEVNKAAIQYYQNLIDELLANGIVPLVTLYHLDLPQRLSDKGGWLNRDTADYFEKYTRVAFKYFGDKVKFWITINEPTTVCLGYESSTLPPYFNLHGVGEYQAGHNILRAHAKAYHVYDKEFRASQNGKVGITLNSLFFFPKTNSNEDKETAQRILQFSLGWFVHPIYSESGDYPQIMRKIIDENSKKEGKASSRLPSFTPEEINSLKGAADFLGINHYTSFKTEPGSTGPDPSWLKDTGVSLSTDPTWPDNGDKSSKVVPLGLRGLLNFIKNQYNNPMVIVTENGYSDRGGLEDYGRISYFQEYLKQLLKAVHEDGCNVKGYTAWGLMDNFELTKGYTSKFGLYSVDFADANRPRTPKKSASYFQALMKTRKLPKYLSSICNS